MSSRWLARLAGWNGWEKQRLTRSDKRAGSPLDSCRGTRAANVARHASLMQRPEGRLGLDTTESRLMAGGYARREISRGWAVAVLDIWKITTSAYPSVQARRGGRQGTKGQYRVRVVGGGDSTM